MQQIADRAALAMGQSLCHQVMGLQVPQCILLFVAQDIVAHGNGMNGSYL